MENSTSFYQFVGFQPPQGPDTDGIEELDIDPGEYALFSDFDGTIVDIASRPDAIKYTGEDADLFAKAMKRFGGAVAIVSGRNLEDVAHYVGVFDGVISGGHGTELRIDGARLRQQLSGLTAAQRRVIELSYFGGHTHAEIAELIGCPLGTVKSRIRDALPRLRRHHSVPAEPVVA